VGGDMSCQVNSGREIFKSEFKWDVTLIKVVGDVGEVFGGVPFDRVSKAFPVGHSFLRRCKRLLVVQRIEANEFRR
jgi:hypothetical protein